VVTSSRFAVAVHVLVALAMQEGRPITSEQVASSVRTNPSVIRRLLSMLADAGLTTSQLGTGGGALLARPAGEITLLDAYRAVEEPELFATHRTPPDTGCIVGRNVLPVLAATTCRAQRALEAELGGVTVADVARGVVERDRAPREAPADA
jgi:Rrf2 family protein